MGTTASEVQTDSSTGASPQRIVAGNASCSIGTAWCQTISKVHCENLAFPGRAHQHHLAVTFRHRVATSSQVLLCLFYGIDVLWYSE